MCCCILQTVMNVDMYVMSRNPDYVEEPLVFKPERWSHDSTAPKMDPFISVPFGFGPRSCYGGCSNKVHKGICSKMLYWYNKL